MGWSKKISSIQINILQRKFQIPKGFNNIAQQLCLRIILIKSIRTPFQS